MKKTLTSILLAVTVCAAAAWEPTKPITVLIGNAPGSGNEISFRIVSALIEKKNDVNFVIINKPGVSELVAANYFAAQPADGYTALVAACQDIYVAPEVWYSNITKFNAMEFEPVATIAHTPLAFWAAPNSKVNNPQELVADIKSKNRTINIAIGGTGHRLAVEYLIEKLKMEGTEKVQIIMYKSGGQALLDVMGGHVEFAVTALAVGWPNVAVNKLKLIGVANEKKLVGLEKYQLMKDSVPGLNIHACWSLVLPKGTPHEVQTWYHDHFVPVIRSKEALEQFEANMMFTINNEHTPQGVRDSMTNLRNIWQPISRRFTPDY